MDYTDYKKLYQTLLGSAGRQEIGEDPKKLEMTEKKISEFLNEFPKIKTIPETPETDFMDLRIRTVLFRTVDTMVKVVHDLHDIILRRHELSQRTLMRQITDVFFRKDRRVYIGIWVVVLSFIMYFLDASV